MSKDVQLECLGCLPGLKASNNERNQRAKSEKEKNQIWALIIILGVSLSSKFQLTQGQMGWNRDLNIYNFKFWVFQNSQFLNAEINSQVAVVNLDKN